MSTLQQKVEAMEKVGAVTVADHTLLKLIRLHLQKYERYLSEVQRELAPFEQRYGLSLCGVSPPLHGRGYGGCCGYHGVDGAL